MKERCRERQNMHLLGLKFSQQGEGLFTEVTGNHDNVALGVYFNKPGHAVKGQMHITFYKAYFYNSLARKWAYHKLFFSVQT